MRAREGWPRECFTQTHVLARESEKMSVKKLVRRVCTGAAASVLMVPLAQAAKLAVNDEAQLNILSPGFTYTTQTAGEASSLSVTTDGYVICANIGEDESNIVKLSPEHARWTLPSAFIDQTTYSGGTLYVNRPISGASVEHTLTCQARGAQGEVVNPFSHFGTDIFQNGYEGKEATQYWSMVNWQPVEGFDWASPDWAQVPTDSCQFDMTTEDSPAVEEPTLCAAATGVVQGGEFGTRSPKMWTASTGANFIYVARIDVRLGEQEVNAANEGFQADENPGIQGLPNSVTFVVRDGFDSDYLSPEYTFCLLDSLPATLSATTCNGNNPESSTGIVSRPIAMDFLTLTSLSRYMVVIRTKTTNLPPISTPVAAVAVLSDPTVARSEHGDTFVGDNVIFGFSLQGDGFPWMTQ